MARVTNLFLHWSVATKQVALLITFGFVPILAIGFIAFSATNDLEQKAGDRFLDSARALADKIDRNLSERYGDVQAFGYNDAVHRISQWYDPMPFNSVSQVMNKYVAAYEIYDLMIMVDTRGDVIAVNNKDARGNSINSQFIFKQNYSQASWFKALSNNVYSTKQPFTSLGNDISTGTFIEDAHIDADVVKATGTDGYVLGFSAPVYGQNGEVVAYWTNRTNMHVVEAMVQKAYEDLHAAGFSGAELTILDKDGRFLVDHDPRNRGTQDVVRNLEKVIMKLNLAEKGVEAAQQAVAGKSGSMYALHARKQIVQAAGYTHLSGALGFPGMNWSVLVRVPKDEAVAEAATIQWKIFVMALICLGLMLPIGLWLGRKQAKGLVEVSHVAQQAAKGDLTQRVKINTTDELGTMGMALNEMFENFGRVVSEVRVATEQVSSASTQISAGNKDLSQRTAEQASSLEETSASMEEITSTVRKNADNAKQANQLAIAAREVAEKGGGVTVKAVDAMEEINKSSKKIADIINVIDEIAFQTNLLALNAAVEAARAGEQGRGFAVVASEVRNLAQRSATAAKEIKDLINESVQKVGDGSKLVNHSGQTLEEIVCSVKRVTDIIAEISAASQEQTAGIDQINKGIIQMDQSTQQNAALVDEVTASAQTMQQQAKGLLTQVEFFRLDDEEKLLSSSISVGGKVQHVAIFPASAGQRRHSLSAISTSNQ